MDVYLLSGLLSSSAILRCQRHTVMGLERLQQRFAPLYALY
jgi:hypothetical protein